MFEAIYYPVNQIIFNHTSVTKIGQHGHARVYRHHPEGWRHGFLHLFQPTRRYSARGGESALVVEVGYNTEK